MKAHAQGGLSHHFHGTYSATIGLLFDTADEAKAALKVLGEPWKLGLKRANVLVCHVESAALDIIKHRLREHGTVSVDCGGAYGCKHHCRESDIDSVNHSIDVGPPFTFECEVANPNQTDLFGGAS